MRRLLVLAAALAAVGATAASAAQTRAVDETIRSVALGGPVHALVVLPPGYDDTTYRYPVVYFLHGLPAGPTAYKSIRWVAQAAADAGSAILVFPQGARPGRTDPEYRNWGPGRDWETYIARELPAYVDAHFRTIPTRAGRAIMGLSAGGYGAAAIGLAHLDRYSVIESWSGYFHATDPSGLHAIAAGPGSNVHLLIDRLKRQPTFLGFYVGLGDDRFRDENEQLNRELAAAKIPHVFAEYPGGHEDALWQSHAVAWLRLALAHLARPS